MKQTGTMCIKAAALLGLLALSACPTEIYNIMAPAAGTYYTVTFNPNGGAPAPADQSVAGGGKVTEPSGGVAKKGFMLDGWYREAEFATKWNFGANTVTGNITLYAKWTKNAAGTFTVTFNSNGGSAANNQAAQNGGKVNQPGGITKAGYTLEGWYKEETLTSRWNFDTDTVTDDILLYAKWTENAAGTYTVTFNGNDGAPNPADQNLVGGNNVTEPTGVTKAGYTLEGWYKDEALTSRWNFGADTVTDNIVLYAKWTENAAGTYTVAFNSNGGSVANSQLVYNGGAVNQPGGITRAGYTLDGWYKEAAFTTRWNFATDAVISNITLYARWVENAPGTYTVTFNSNGGAPVPADQNVAGGNRATEPSGVIQTGYTLEGWYKEAAFTTRWNFATDTVTGNIVLYAKWTQNPAGTFTVTFNSNGGTSTPAAQVVSGGGTVTEPSGVTRAGYTLEGWYKEAAFTTRWNFAADTVTDNIILYAKWTQNPAETTYMPGELMTRTVSGKTINFRYVPAGSFQRDSVAANVTIITRGYWMGETEVTQELFQAVMGVNPSHFQGSSYPPAIGEVQAKRPVEQVSWYDAITFCNKLSLLDGKDPVYSVSGISDWANLTYSDIPTAVNGAWNAATQDLTKNGYRLPTEMEWMWAVMGADKTVQPNTTGYNKAFAGSNGSNSVGDYAWYRTNSIDKSHEVGTKLPNELNLYDMSGNVFEWCWDWYAAYGSSSQTDPTGPGSGSYRVNRGGSWNLSGVDLRSAGRNSFNPSGRFYYLGFRLVRPE